MKYYPIFAKLEGKSALVIGGGPIAERKIKSLLEIRAMVTVISPEITVTIKQLAQKHRLKWINRRVLKTDFTKAWLIVAATDNSEINSKISSWAKKNKIWVNVVDQPQLSDFISPAVFSKGGSTVAVSTDGINPKFSRDLKNFIKENWNEFLSYRGRLSKRSS